jgi:integrase
MAGASAQHRVKSDKLSAEGKARRDLLPPPATPPSRPQAPKQQRQTSTHEYVELSLKELMLSQEDKRLTAYSFRHSYSVRGTRRGIDSGSMATSMGHSIQTHCQHYPWAERSSTAEAFAKATALMVAT